MQMKNVATITCEMQKEFCVQFVMLQ